MIWKPLFKAITWESAILILLQKTGKTFRETGKAILKKQVKRNPEVYTCGGNKDNFRYPYCYGDFTYAEK
ncbi:hypothetical protein BsIDN1_36670 [Bacillus safensis]|uniref:Uncharacterized protein n=1 Tax=Bacillus safensis TaxID=561879 RepID=A0A5S9MDM5_BACIA|nr:hypothetical protein BsIDN1_36670 [Bacillus safensis]